MPASCSTPLPAGSRPTWPGRASSCSPTGSCRICPEHPGRGAGQTSRLGVPSGAPAPRRSTMARYRRFDVTGETPAVPVTELDDVRMRRAGLKAALSSLEIALAAPRPARATWVAGVRDGLHALHEVWTRHIVE